jgi:mRNA interferase HigB
MRSQNGNNIVLLPRWEHPIFTCRVWVISRKTLREFWERDDCKDSEQPLKAWFKEAEKADWATPADIKASYRSASILKNGRAVFNVGGNKYRLVVMIHYELHIVYIRFVGTHAEYDDIDANEV